MIIETPQDIFSNGTWHGPNTLVLDLFSPVHSKSFKVPLDFFPHDEEKVIRPETLQAIKDFQHLTTKDYERVEQAIWENVLERNKTYKYSNDQGKTWQESPLEKNLEDRGVPTKEAMLTKMTFAGFGVYNDSTFELSQFFLFYSCEWDPEHGVTVLFSNGVFDEISD